MPLVHHELCFGCGRTNLFGVMLELEATGPGEASGRCFIKQDHQGADRGTAHDGVIAAALSEAMALSCGPDARVRRLELELGGQAPVGTFVEITASADGQIARASAFADGALIARASGTYDSHRAAERS